MALFGKTPEREPVKAEGVVEIGGSYACMTCNKTTRGAKYITGANVLMYKCPDGHTNKIEDFGLDLR